MNPEVRTRVRRSGPETRVEATVLRSAVDVSRQTAAVDRPGQQAARDRPRDPHTTTDAIVAGRAISNLICSSKFIVDMLLFYISPVALTKLGKNQCWLCELGEVAISVS